MSKEAGYPRAIKRDREGVKNHLEGPNWDIDKIILSLQENDWKVPDALAQDFPHLADPATAKAVVAAVWHVFAPEAHADQDQGDDEHPRSTW